MGMNRFEGMQLLKRGALAFIFLLGAAGAQAQVTGGQAAFEYLNLSQSPHITALGGINVSNPEKDVTLMLQNPALNRPGLHNELSLNYNAYYAGISVANLAYSYYVPKIGTSFGLGVQYLNYGNFVQTDNIGNEYGSVSASDYAVTLSASHAYGERWRAGAALKFAQSSLYDRRATALLADVGVVYTDTANLLSLGITAKNMGAMVQKYNPSGTSEPMPFDLQLGISKRFAHLPLRLMGTVHQLYEWNVRYNNPDDIDRSNVFGTADTVDNKSHFGDKLLRHFIIGAELLVGKRITVTVAYNHLRRGELSLAEKRALSGFSFGAGIHLNKFQVFYARSYYHLAGANNEFGLNVSLSKFTGLGKTGEKWHWNSQYDDPEM